MTDTTRTGQHAAHSATNDRPVRQIHHGRTGAAWAGSMIALAAFLVGAIGLVLGNWVIFWIGAALVVVALIVTLVLRRMGYGAD